VGIEDDIGLPAPILRALINDDYDPGLSDITATGLLTAPRVVQLRRQHKDRMVVKASRLVPALLGKAFHAMAEKHAAADEIAEVRLYAHCLDWLIGGAIDLQTQADNSFKIIDYKTVKTTALHLSAKKWEEQLNIYGWLAQENSKRVSGLEIVAILKDWREVRVGSPGYPAAPVVVVKIPLWPFADARDFVTDLTRRHQEAAQELPLCSDEDRWLHGDRFFVGKKVFDTEREALIHRGDGKAKVRILPGKPLMCLRDYCGVSEICSQWQDEKKHGGRFYDPSGGDL